MKKADGLLNIEEVKELLFKYSETLTNSLQLNTDFLPLRLAAIKYHISESYLYKLHYKKRIKFHKLGALTYIRSSELESLFEEVAA